MRSRVQPHYFNTERHTFWNMSSILNFYLQSFLGIQSKVGKAAAPNNGFIATKSLERAWENAADAFTAADALNKYKILAELLSMEVDRLQAVKGPGRLMLLYPLRQQQSECASRILRLLETIKRNERVSLPF